MKLTCPSFEDDQMIPSIYTCDSDNINPPLEISDVPQGTKSLALIMDDPDAPGGAFTHWMMWNIPPDTKIIDENDWPQGAEQGLNDGGELGYYGPCPPEGVHHYRFKLYALKNELNLLADVKAERLEREIEENLIEKTELTGLYKLTS
jgi:Raf kinase inhibitor-like YbhB/YbcL family protein